MKAMELNLKNYQLNNKIRPYSKDIINGLKKVDAGKIQSTIAINFISSKDAGEEQVMHLKSDT